MTKSELINLLAPYGDDEHVVFVTFEDGITVYERVEVARSHATTVRSPRPSYAIQLANTRAAR
mgnify:CR=1 FL=1